MDLCHNIGCLTYSEIQLGTSSEKNGIMWEKFPRGKAPPPPPSPSMGIFSTKYRFFSEDVPKRTFFKIVKYVF